MKYVGTMENIDGVLQIGGVSVTELKEKFGTPLYIYDLELMEEKIRNLKEGFKSSEFNTTIVYASKAYLSRGMTQIINRNDLHIDAVSAGELMTILSTSIDPKKVHMHGNNKSTEELELSISKEIGSIILDGKYEAQNVSKICEKLGKNIDVMLRVNIGIDAHTHEYIKTAKHTSKFGESIFDKNIYEIVSDVITKKGLNFLGFHCHIGSQIFDEVAYFEAIDIMVKFTKEISEKFNIYIPEINIGGGFGVRYCEDDTDVNLKKLTKKLIKHLELTLHRENLKIKNVSIEPGRSIVAEAGSTLYTIGGKKKTFGGEKYIFVDGGMSDNIRPALYQAKYESIVANKLNDEKRELVTVAGKCCESGDILIKGTKLVKSEINDLLLVSCTGAYGHSMSSSYNKALKPGVVFVKEGRIMEISKRESYEDLMRNDMLIEE